MDFGDFNYFISQTVQIWWAYLHKKMQRFWWSNLYKAVYWFRNLHETIPALFFLLSLSICLYFSCSSWNTCIQNRINYGNALHQRTPTYSIEHTVRVNFDDGKALLMKEQPIHVSSSFTFCIKQENFPQ